MADLDYLDDDDYDPPINPFDGDLTDDDFDFEDVDCVSCGLKFYIRPSLYVGSAKPFPTECERCRMNLPPLYEY